jgi:hypothetical protein
LFTLLKNTNGFFRKIVNLVIWAAFGALIMTVLVCRDVFYLIKILTYHKGCRFGQIDELEE